MGYDINDIYQSNSDFLKAEDIGANFWTATIRLVEMKSFDNGERKLAIGFNELDKSLLLNMTNARTIGDLYGGDTDNWVGKQIMLFTMPVDYQGKKVQAVRLRAPAPTGAPQHRQPGQMQPQANTRMGGRVSVNDPQLNQQARQNYAQPSGYDDRNPPPPTGNEAPF